MQNMELAGEKSSRKSLIVPKNGVIGGGELLDL